MIRLGPMSLSLLVGALWGVLVAVLLWGAPRNRAANRCLAGVIGVLVLQLVPDILGFAGVYDAHPGLSFLPYDLMLACGPLLWAHGHALAHGRMPPRWGLHLAPAAGQLAYYLWLFPQPLAFKDDWDTVVHVPWVEPAETLAMLASLSVYSALALRRYHRWQAGLAAMSSQADDLVLEGLRRFLWALVATVVVWAGFLAVDAWIRPLGYFGFFPLHLWLAVLVVLLGMEGLRHAGTRYPAWPAEAAPAPVDEPPRPEPEPEPALGPAPAEATAHAAAGDAAARAAREAQGRRWLARLAEAGWWRDPALDLATLARHLGTNTHDLSRAINEGLGHNFNEMVNRLRVAAVQQALRDDAARGGARPLLDIAFEAGFASKASFNRSFKALTGQTPTQWREQALASTMPGAGAGAEGRPEA